MAIAVADAPSPWLKVPDAAERARVGTRTIYSEIRAARLRAGGVGGKRSYRLLAAWVDAWLEETTTPKEGRWSCPRIRPLTARSLDVITPTPSILTLASSAPGGNAAARCRPDTGLRCVHPAGTQ